MYTLPCYVTIAYIMKDGQHENWKERSDIFQMRVFLTGEEVKAQQGTSLLTDTDTSVTDSYTLDALHLSSILYKDECVFTVFPRPVATCQGLKIGRVMGTLNKLCDSSMQFSAAKVD